MWLLSYSVSVIPSMKDVIVIIPYPDGDRQSRSERVSVEYGKTLGA